jgi:hypothetical protein
MAAAGDPLQGRRWLGLLCEANGDRLGILCEANGDRLGIL